MVVGIGRVHDLAAIIDLLVRKSAQEHDKALAEVRSTVDLTPEQRDRLAQAIEKATGKKVEVKVIIDEGPSSAAWSPPSATPSSTVRCAPASNNSRTRSRQGSQWLN